MNMLPTNRKYFFGNIILFLLLTPLSGIAQNKAPQEIELTGNWQFFYPEKDKWFPATVPGTIHTDLLANDLIPDPYFRDNETGLQWVGQSDWKYKTRFDVPPKIWGLPAITLSFEGLDTYADVYLNGKLILQSSNMFRDWNAEVKKLLKQKNNLLELQFFSAQKKADSLARAYLPIVLPDNNRVYVRKAQYHFGWDWGPTFITCGIWRSVKLVGGIPGQNISSPKVKPWDVKLVREKDNDGTSFYFRKDGEPVYCKGANWIPAEMFLPRLKKEDYRQLLLMAKNANMNMLRVWGGGIYESEDFYSLCDSLGIMIWQDFMFAGGMVPGDDAFFANVKEEVRYQLTRLSQHPCIVIWCGNNEIDEAWHNWGWQQQFNLHSADSAKVWNDYRRLFEDSLPRWVKQFDQLQRPYTSTSPIHGWGHKESFTEGDSHYWGVWWGLEDWEAFENKTGRFISEYGMQAMPNEETIKRFTNEEDRYLFSPVILHHQKASNGFKKIEHYLTRYFIDSAQLAKLSLSSYTYLTQCLQYYVLKNSIAVHRSRFPRNMGTLLWQLDDCWPVSSWSITDYSRQSKAAWYAVKEAYRDDVLPKKDSVYPKKLALKKANISFRMRGNKLLVTADEEVKYAELSLDGNTSVFSENYFDLKKGETKIVFITISLEGRKGSPDIKVRSLYDVLHN